MTTTEFYAIHAIYEVRLTDGYTSSQQIPTFYLAARAQGIVDTQHAEAIARDILTSTNPKDDDRATLHVYAVAV